MQQFKFECQACIQLRAWRRRYTCRSCPDSQTCVWSFGAECTARKAEQKDENVGQANEDDPLWIKGNLQLSKQIIKCGQHFHFQFNRFESEIPSIKCPNSKAISSGFLFFECSSTGPIRNAHTQVEELMDRPATKCLIQWGGGCRDRDMWQCEELLLLLPLCYY